MCVCVCINHKVVFVPNFIIFAFTVIFYHIESDAVSGDKSESEFVVELFLEQDVPEKIMNGTLEMQIPIHPEATCGTRHTQI